MSPDPKTNYLCHTAPESKEQFISLLTQVELFHGLPENLCSRIFDYAKFIELQNGDRPVVEGMFDQEIFLLISGKLDVFIKLPGEGEKQIDSLTQPFTLFGERCLLGQPRGASIQANGRVLLLGLDLSSLPDVTEHAENPGLRLDDDQYKNNYDLYMVVANVLYARLVRLQHDQYKLIYKIREVHRRAQTHRTMSLKTKLYNELVVNGLPVELRNSAIWSRMIREFKVTSAQAFLVTEQVDTQLIYNHLVKAQAKGEVEDEDWMYHLLNRLAEQARYVPHYLSTPIAHNHLPDLLQMASCLVALYEEMMATGLIDGEERLDNFLSKDDQKQAWNPSRWTQRVRLETPDAPWFARSQLGLALSGALIEWVGKANQAIASYVDFLADIHSRPKQKNLEVGAQMVGEFERFYTKIQAPREQASKAEPPSSEAKVEDLLAQFGM